MYTFVYFRDHNFKRDHYVFYEHVDTRISSLSYIKLKRLDNDIKTKSISKTCTNYETKGKPRKKMPHPGIEPELCEKQKLGVHGAEQFNVDTSRPHYRRYQKCYNLYSSSEPDKLVA